jgi:fibronectin-binding autotransporter adhesin
MSVKTAGVGHFTIPTAPAAGTSCTSGAANVFTTTYVQLIASTAAALYITGIYVEEAAVTAGTYIIVQLATGAAASETIVGQHLISPHTGSTVTRCYKPIFPPIPVAISTRIACKTADSVGAQAKLITLECIAQSNVVDDGIAVGTVTTVTNQLTAAAIATGVWQDAVGADFTTASSIGKALFISNIVPGASGGHMISGTNAGTTTLGALTVTGATTLTGNLVLSDGLTISAPSTLNRAGLDITGNGTGAAIKAAAGATGKGVAITTTAGDGLSILPTAGSAIVATGNGTSKFGLIATGGTAGTSDGISAVAGVGGVDIRGNITGNLVGTVSTLTTYTGNTVQTGDSFARIGAAGVGLSNIGTIATCTTLTNLPAITANWLTAAGITAGALNGKGDWNIGKTGYALSAAGVQALWDALVTALTTVGSIGKKLADWTIGTTQTADVAAVKTQTDKLTFTVANQVDSNIQSVNDVTVNGIGTAGSPWGP